MAEAVFRSGDRVRTIKPSLWPGETGTVKSALPPDKRHKLKLTTYLVRSDRNYDLTAKSDEMERI